ncbi:MAG: GatB/YqeY domain-containing protein [Pseudomonadota bacterium]
MAIKDDLQADVKDALRAADKARVTVLRMALAAIKQREVDDRVELDEQQVLGIVEKMVKQRRESITQFDKGGRADLADKERAEITVLERYLPEQLSDAELEALVAGVIADTGAAGMRDMGKVMGQIKAKAAGRADMSAVGALVRARLGA